MVVILLTSASQSTAQGLHTDGTETKASTISDPLQEKHVDSCFDRHFHGKVIQNLQEMVLRDRGSGNSQQSSWSKDQTMATTILLTPVLFGGYLVQLEGHVATLVICPH